MSKALFKSTSLVSTMTLISRVLGFIRDMVAAQIFGVTASVDAFNFAFKIPNFMRNLFAEGSFSQAFVPVLSEYRQKHTASEVRVFINHVAGALGSVLFLLVILGMIGAPFVVSLFAPGFEGYRFDLSAEMLRVTFPYLMLISLTAFSGAILNSYGNFAIPAVTPALLNICMIASALWLAPLLKIPVESQAWGVLIAGVVQLSFQLPFLYRLGFFPQPKWNWQDPGVKRVMLLMLPSLFGASIGQISLLINTIFASFLQVGSVTWLYFSERLAYFPLGVFGVALATVVLPHLSRKHADNAPEQFMSALDWGVRLNLLIGIPATVVLMVCSGPIITTLFQYGKFSPFDVQMTQRSVLAYALGLQAFMLVKILSSGFFATQNTKTPVKIGVFIVVMNLILNALLVVPLAHAGLALAASICSWMNVSLLLFSLYRRGVYRFQAGWGIFLLRLVVANVVLGLLLAWAAGDIQPWVVAKWPVRLSHLTILFGLAFACYFSTLALMGMRFRHFRSL